MAGLFRERREERAMIQVDKINFEEEVLQAEGPVLVDFWSPNCEPCMALLPDIEALEKKHGDQDQILQTQRDRKQAPGHKPEGSRPADHMHLQGRREGGRAYWRRRERHQHRDDD